MLPAPPPAAEHDIDRRALVLSNLGLAGEFAERYCRIARIPRSEYEDVRGFARIGLVEAARDFDPTRNLKFSTLAWWKMRKAMNGICCSVKPRVPNYLRSSKVRASGIFDGRSLDPETVAAATRAATAKLTPSESDECSLLTLLVSPEPGPSSRLEREEETRRLRRVVGLMLERLPAKQRAAVLARWGLAAPEEVAAVPTTENARKALLVGAMKTLREGPVAKPSRAPAKAGQGSRVQRRHGPIQKPRGRKTGDAVQTARDEHAS